MQSEAINMFNLICEAISVILINLIEITLFNLWARQAGGGGWFKPSKRQEIKHEPHRIYFFHIITRSDTYMYQACLLFNFISYTFYIGF